MTKTRKDTVSSNLMDDGAKKREKKELQDDEAGGSSPTKKQKRTKGKTNEASEKDQVWDYHELA